MEFIQWVTGTSIKPLDEGGMMTDCTWNGLFKFDEFDQQFMSGATLEYFKHKNTEYWYNLNGIDEDTNQVKIEGLSTFLYCLVSSSDLSEYKFDVSEIFTKAVGLVDTGIDFVDWIYTF